MPIEPLILCTGDPYRCQRALREREAELTALDPGCERHPLFADEVDPSGLELELRSASLFASGRHFVIRQMEKVSAPVAKRWSALIERGVSDGTFVTLIAADLKATSPIVKACKKRGKFVALPAPRGRAVASSARAVLSESGVRIRPPALERLIHRSGGDLLSIAQEARKLRSYDPSDEIEEQTVIDLAFPAAEQTVYPFFDHIGAKDLQGALRTLDELREDPGRVLGGAIRHLTRLTMVRLLLDRRIAGSKMASLIGAPDWLLRRLIGQAKCHRIEELTAALDLGVRLDVRIKSGAMASSDALLELVLAVTRPA